MSNDNDKDSCANCDLIHKAHRDKFKGCASPSIDIARDALGLIAQRYLDLTKEAQEKLSPEELEEYSEMMSRNMMETYAKMIPMLLMDSRKMVLPFDPVELLEVFAKYVDEVFTKLGYDEDVPEEDVPEEDVPEEDTAFEHLSTPVNSAGSKEEN